MYYRVRNSNYQRSGTYISKPKFAEPDAAGVDVKCKGWLMNNSHNTNPLLKSIQEQYSKHLQLTQKQWSIVEAQMNRSNYVAVPKVPVKLGSPIPIMINRTAAFKEIRDKLKLDYGVFAVKINRVLNSGKARNGNKWAELEVLPDADTPVSCCRVCGKTLKDHRSIVSGIGPDCAKKFKTIYHSYSTNNLQVFRDDFKKLISKLGPIQIKLWSNQVTENYFGFETALDIFAKQQMLQASGYPSMPAPAPNPPANIIPPVIDADLTTIHQPSKARIHMDVSKFKVINTSPAYKFILEVQYDDICKMPIEHIGGGNIRLDITDNQIIELYNPLTGNAVSFNKTAMDTDLYHLIFEGDFFSEKVRLIIK